LSVGRRDEAKSREPDCWDTTNGSAKFQKGHCPVDIYTQPLSAAKRGELSRPGSSSKSVAGGYAPFPGRAEFPRSVNRTMSLLARGVFIYAAESQKDPRSARAIDSLCEVHGASRLGRRLVVDALPDRYMMLPPRQTPAGRQWVGRTGAGCCSFGGALHDVCKRAATLRPLRLAPGVQDIGCC
jgi:hypothetical protein